MPLGELALLDGELAALLAIVDDARQRVVLMLQARLVDLAGHRVGVVDLGAVDLLERLHGADGADQLEIAVVGQQIAGEVERQRRDGMRRHEVAHLEPHLAEVEVRQRGVVVCVLHAQYRVAIVGLAIDLAAGDAEADDRRLAEGGPVGIGVDEALEQLAVQVAKPIGDAEFGTIAVVLRQPDTEVVVAHVGGEVVPHHARNALAGVLVDDRRLEHFDRREGVVLVLGPHAQLAGDDVELDGVAIRLGVVPVRQGVEAVVDHRQGIAQVLLAPLPTRQVGEVGGGARVLGRAIIFVEPHALDIECEIVTHREQAPW